MFWLQNFDPTLQIRQLHLWATCGNFYFILLLSGPGKIVILSAFLCLSLGWNNFLCFVSPLSRVRVIFAVPTSLLEYAFHNEPQGDSKQFFSAFANLLLLPFGPLCDMLSTRRRRRQLQANPVYAMCMYGGLENGPSKEGGGPHICQEAKLVYALDKNGRISSLLKCALPTSKDEKFLISCDEN